MSTVEGVKWEMAQYASWPSHKKLHYELKSRAVSKGMLIVYAIVLVVLVLIILLMVNVAAWARVLIAMATFFVGIGVYKIIEHMLCRRLSHKLQRKLGITHADPQYASKMLAELSKH